ncbi:glycosyltransferase family 2 protein [Paenibacillus piri]|uniref:Glycosyltransferase n=1 Tax=Paenibacillus piri TaxID=2547395 RepID=A0A4R5KYU3_9BACL|nr:glycosyltransferase [Paenibacillus piri]TDG00318.1 glycosyltransferase [Paenibacillus piri]
MKDVLVSVIVPVYNLEQYVGRALDSLLEQTLRSIEIIVVNDGSTDGSGTVAEAYARNDGRIKVVHKTNGGVSSARNTGLELAQGEYVTFVDPDDFIDRRAYEHMYDTASQTGCDIVICGFSYVSEANLAGESARLPIIANVVLGKQEIREQIWYNLLYSDMDAGVWNKLYRRDLLGRHRIRFDETVLFTEDHLFNLVAFTYAGHAIYIPEPFYRYVVSIPNSASKKYRYNYFQLYEHVYLFKLKLLSVWGWEEDRSRRAAANYFVYQSMKAMINEFSKASPKSFLQRVRSVKEMVDSPVLRQGVHVVEASPDYVNSLYSLGVFNYIRKRNWWMLCLAGLYYNSFMVPVIRKIKSSIARREAIQ